MKITPITEEEIKYLRILPEGEYDFLIFDAIDTTSKSGNEMIHLILDIINNNKKYIIHEYLLNNEINIEKIRNICESIGILDKYNSSIIEAKDFKDKKGRAKVSIKNDNDYIKNVVKKYIKKETVDI